VKRLEEIARFCADVDRSVAFYETLLGVKPVSRHPGETATFMVGEVKLFLHQRAAGLTVEVAPRDFSWGRSAYLRDPDGRLVELHRPR